MALNWDYYYYEEECVQSSIYLSIYCIYSCCPMSRILLLGRREVLFVHSHRIAVTWTLTSKMFFCSLFSDSSTWNTSYRLRARFWIGPRLYPFLLFLYRLYVFLRGGGGDNIIILRGVQYGESSDKRQKAYSISTNNMAIYYYHCLFCIKYKKYSQYTL